MPPWGEDGVSDTIKSESMPWKDTWAEPDSWTSSIHGGGTMQSQSHPFDKSPTPQTFSIFVKYERLLSLLVDSDSSVDFIKQAVQQKTDIPSDQQSLLFGGKILQSGKSLFQYNVQGGSTLFLSHIRALPGGGRSIKEFLEDENLLNDQLLEALSILALDEHDLCMATKEELDAALGGVKLPIVRERRLRKAIENLSSTPGHPSRSPTSTSRGKTPVEAAVGKAGSTMEMVEEGAEKALNKAEGAADLLEIGTSIVMTILTIGETIPFIGGVCTASKAVLEQARALETSMIDSRLCLSFKLPPFSCRSKE